MNSKAPSKETLRAIVIEDHHPTLELLTEVLHSAGLEVYPFVSGEDALQLMLQERFDGIFLDLNLPGMHGLEFARRIRRSNWNATTPIIIITGVEGRESMQDAFSVGATFYVSKPIDRPKLTKLLHTLRGSLAASRKSNLPV